MKEHINKWAAANCWDQMVFNQEFSSSSETKVIQVLIAVSNFSPLGIRGVWKVAHVTADFLKDFGEDCGSCTPGSPMSLLDK